MALLCATLVLPRWAIAPPVQRDHDCACVLSHTELAALAALRSQKSDTSSTATLTVDLGRHQPEEVTVDSSGVRLAIGLGRGATYLPWAFVNKAIKKGRVGAWECWRDDPGASADDNGVEWPSRIEGFSELTSRTASLYPLEGAVPPTAVLGGFNMHRLKGISPADDTDRKLNALGTKLRGNVLDICTGLGYTAIGAASRPSVSQVVTIELDPLMIEMQRANPWSDELFEDAPSETVHKVTRLLGDATDILPELPEGAFDACIHDPPVNALSGELYSEEFYAQIRRCLRPNGALFHYIGDPSSKASGRLFKGIGERLRAAGYTNVKTSSKAYGIAALAAGNGPS